MKIVDIVGARPQFIKLAPILKAIECYNEKKGNPVEELFVHTGQHYDYKMSDVFFDDLDLKEPDYHLGVGSGSHAYQTGEILKRVEEVLLKEKPDLVMVYGDTNSTLAGALASTKIHIPIAHIEAGLRSFNRKMPEEINRVIVDHISNLLFCPTETSVKNLKKEGFTNIINNGKLISFEETIHITKGNGYHKPLVLNVGDVMFDAVLKYSELAKKKSSILKNLGLKPQDYALATVHRAENTDILNRLENIFNGFVKIARSGLTVVVPLHPRTKKILKSSSLNSLLKNLLIIEPASYLDMLVLEKNARVILTDSGGVQKESFFFKVPCVTLREETEWIETVETGWNMLAGCDPERIYQTALEASPGNKTASPYGDGRAAERIVQWLKI